MKNIKSFKLFENDGSNEIDPDTGLRIGRLVNQYLKTPYRSNKSKNPDLYFKFENQSIWDNGGLEYRGNFDFPYDEFIYNDFYEMDADWGTPKSYFGTNGLGVGDPKRSSKSYDWYAGQGGRMIVRVRRP